MNDDELELLAEKLSENFRRRSRCMEDFRYDEIQEKYWEVKRGELLGAKSVDGAIPKDLWPTRPEGKDGDPKPYRPSVAINDIDTGLTVETSTWWPGKPQFIENQIVTSRGIQDLEGAVVYNRYIPPTITPPPEGVTEQRWREHVELIYPEETEQEHFYDFCAHAVQRPDEKVNHGIVLAGAQGIGKDTALLPVRRGVGEWNAAEVGPEAVTAAYNPHIVSVLIIINEVRAHDADHKASTFYNALKPLLASPPEMLPMEVKYANPVYVRNLAHVVLTTNDPLSMYIPKEDRRLFIMTSPLEGIRASDILDESYFRGLHEYLNSGGSDAAIQWLMNRDLSGFRPAAPPPQTVGRQKIVDSAQYVRRNLADEVFDRFVEEHYDEKKPDVFFHKDLLQFIPTMDSMDEEQEMVAKVNAKNFHYKMAERGYDLVRNGESGEWRNGSFRSRGAYVLRSVPASEHFAVVARALKKRPLEFVAKPEEF